jgi:hypothetical protein
MDDAQSRVDQETADARDPEAAARRTRDDAIDQAKRDSIQEERATISTDDQVGGQVDQNERVVSERGADTHDPGKAVRREIKKDIKDS